MAKTVMIFLPSPLVGEGGAERSSATGEGLSIVVDELCENVLRNGRRSLQHVIVPVTRDSKTFRHQDGFSRRVTLRRRVLTTIYFNDDAPFKANEVENKALKGDLPAKFEEREPSIAKQSPHGCFGIGRRAAHFLCEISDALGGRSMAWRLRHEPLTRRLTPFGATLSHKGRGKISLRVAGNYTRIGIST
jgi:hypothetical protein